MANHKRLTSIIFDIGGVLAHITKAPLHRWLDHFDNWESRFFDDDFTRMQIGALTAEEFLARKSKQFSKPTTVLHDAFAQMINAIHAKPILAPLKLPFLFASNINEIHYATFCRHIGISPDTVCSSRLSYQVGCLKPDPRMFQLVAKELTEDPKTVLYIDDKKENLQQASKVGFRTSLCTSPTLLNEVLKKHRLI